MRFFCETVHDGGFFISGELGRFNYQSTTPTMGAESSPLFISHHPVSRARHSDMTEIKSRRLSTPKLYEAFAPLSHVLIGPDPLKEGQPVKGDELHRGFPVFRGNRSRVRVGHFAQVGLSLDPEQGEPLSSYGP